MTLDLYNATFQPLGNSLKLLSLEERNTNANAAFDAFGIHSLFPTTQSSTASFTVYLDDVRYSVYSAVDRYVYDMVGNVTRMIDPLGRTSQTTYDVMNRPVTSFNAIGNAMTMAYTSSGQVRSRKDYKGAVENAYYNLRDQLSRSIDKDPDGRVFVSDSASGILAQSGWFTVRDGITYVPDPADESDDVSAVYVDFEYDAAGQIVKKSQGLAQPNWLIVDDGDDPAQLLEVIFLGYPNTFRDTIYKYDRIGRLFSQTDPDPDGPTSAQQPENQASPIHSLGCNDS